MLSVLISHDATMSTILTSIQGQDKKIEHIKLAFVFFNDSINIFQLYNCKTRFISDNMETD